MQPYDIVIVGAGSAGSILAARLTEDAERSVLLLEAGPDYPDPETLPNDVKYGYGPDRPFPIPLINENRSVFVARYTDEAPVRLVPRGRVTGGSSAVNAQILLRGVPEDYDDWAAMGNDEWSYRKLLPYFRRSESDRSFEGDFHGSDGPIPVSRFSKEEMNADQQAFYDACLAYGFPDCPDHNDPDSTGVGPTPLNNVDGVRWSTALGYLSEARERPKLTIAARTQARRLLFEGRRVVGVEVESDGQVEVFHGDEVVLAGGAIGSPHLLMLSGVGHVDHLEQTGISVVQDTPGVGGNLRDHPQVSLKWRTRKSYRHDTSAAGIQTTLRYTASGSHLRNDMLIHPSSFCVLDPFPLKVDQYMELGVNMIVCLDLEVGAGSIELRCDDYRIQPRLDYNFLVEPFDRQRMREGVHIALELADHPRYRELLAERVDPDDSYLQSDDSLDAWMRTSVGTSHHISGTCKMGPVSDGMAVVDQYGRVHGLDGLRVVDASIMPDCIRANTNATTLAIAERISDFIRSGM